MTLKNFKKALALLKRTRDDHDKLKEALQNIFIDMSSLGVDKREIDMFDIIQMAMDDKGDWLGYWFYELGGKFTKKKVIQDKDGKNIPLRNVKDLYNLIINNK